MSTAKFPVADSYENIKGYATSYTSLLNSLGRGIVKSNPQDEQLIIYFEVDRINDLIRRGGNGVTFLAGVLGVHKQLSSDMSEFTISLLCADSNGSILPGHVNNTIPGEEVWPNRKKVSDISSALP